MDICDTYYVRVCLDIFGIYIYMYIYNISHIIYIYNICIYIYLINSMNLDLSQIADTPKLLESGRHDHKPSHLGVPHLQI